MESKTRGKVWSDAATRALITLWSEEAIQISLDTCKTSRQTSKVYQIILRQLESKGYKEFTLKEIVNKMKKLRQKYKEEKDKTKKSGNGVGKKWKFFDELDAFLMRKHNVTPPCLVDAMAEVQNQSFESAAEDESSTVNDLIEKYGGGEISVCTCVTCGYEQEVRSEGVHVTEGGGIQVFSAANEFSCPNCDASQDSHDVDEPYKETSMVNDVEKTDKPESTGMRNENGFASTKNKLPGKTERKSGIEKSLGIVLDKMKQIAEDDFGRYQKLEEQRIAKEYEFRMKQLNMEKEMRKEEREHELKVLQLLVAQQSPNVPQPSSSPFNMPVSGFLPSSTPFPAMSQTIHNSGTTNYSVYPTSETNEYFKL